MLAQVQKLDTPPVEYSALLPILVMLGGAVLLMVIGALLPRRAKPWWHAAFTVVTALVPRRPGGRCGSGPVTTVPCGWWPMRSASTASPCSSAS
jgi:hypothetical protein